MTKKNLKTLIKENIAVGILVCVVLCTLLVGIMKIGIDNSISDANKLVTQLKTENAELKKALDTTTEDLNKTRATNKATQDENAELKERLDKAEIDNKRVEKKIDTIVDALKN